MDHRTPPTPRGPHATRSTGLATDDKTNVVYTVDLARGVDVYTVELPGGGRADGQSAEPTLPPASATTASPLLTAGPEVVPALAGTPVGVLGGDRPGDARRGCAGA